MVGSEAKARVSASHAGGGGGEAERAGKIKLENEKKKEGEQARSGGRAPSTCVRRDRHKTEMIRSRRNYERREGKRRERRGVGREEVVALPTPLTPPSGSMRRICPCSRST